MFRGSLAEIERLGAPLMRMRSIPVLEVEGGTEMNPKTM